MSVSSGTLNLFGGLALAVCGAFGAAHILKNPDRYGNATESFSAYLRGDPPPGLVRTAAGDDNAAIPDTPGTVTLKATSAGHFEAEAEVNGRRVDVMVDTGATIVALTYEDAERAGIFLRDSDFTHQVATANGVAKIAPVMLSSISIGGITVRNVQGAVTERGKLHVTLLGMSFLGKLTRVNMQANSLVLHE
jgi:aspartyl protease family protein